MTAEQREILQDNFGLKTKAELAKLTGLSYASVKQWVKAEEKRRSKISLPSVKDNIKKFLFCNPNISAAIASGFSETHVYRVAKEMGLSVNSPAALTEEQKEFVLMLFASGKYRHKTVCDKFSLNMPFIMYHAKKLGVTASKKQRRQNTILRLRALPKHWSIKSKARALGMVEGYINNLSLEAGISIRHEKSSTELEVLAFVKSITDEKIVHRDRCVLTPLNAYL
jgi:hypothetical protein